MKGRKSLYGASNRTVEVKPRGSEARVDSTSSTRRFERPMFNGNLMEEICDRNNLQMALKRVIDNKGSAGVDGMTAEELPDFLRNHWSVILNQLLSGNYIPQPIKRVEIPKPNSQEKRKLGIPTCVDRLIQQATLQILQRKWDPYFSDNSFGFRPGRSCHQAINQVQKYLQDGYEFVVDIDLSKFFDRVCHDRLMMKLVEVIPDPRVLKLIRSYLTAGILENGLISVPKEGTPQGGPVTPRTQLTLFLGTDWNDMFHVNFLFDRIY